jgi:predicted DNA-binding mobile mystery protein A
MKSQKKKLLMEQLDRKLAQMKPIDTLGSPARGWVHAIRTTLRMSLRQLGERLNLSPQGVDLMEEREQSGSITLNSLRSVADALGMKLVYGLVPKEESLEKMIEKQALKVARQIVEQTSQSMKLEDQENPPERLEKAISNMADELKRTMPRYLWD